MRDDDHPIQLIPIKILSAAEEEDITQEVVVVIGIETPDCELEAWGSVALLFSDDNNYDYDHDNLAMVALLVVNGDDCNKGDDNGGNLNLVGGRLDNKNNLF